MMQTQDSDKARLAQVQKWSRYSKDIVAGQTIDIEKMIVEMDVRFLIIATGSLSGTVLA
jgi:hypothetical protein